jgi:hypothetical protein
MKKTARTVDDYIKGFPLPVQKKLKIIRKVVKKNAPEASEKIGYGMPSYNYQGVLLYFAAYEGHIGLYAMPSAIRHFSKDLEKYKTSKGTIQFSLDKKIPEALITKIVKFRVNENLNKKKPILLFGGNPQIAKAEGNAPVQAYIAAIPGWKRKVGLRIDALIVKAVPDVHKAVKWNSPFYGIEGQGWFLSFHCFAKYIKVAFFRGASLRPPPQGESKHKEVRYLDIHENDKIDEAQFIKWVKQASKLPGWNND